MTVAAQHPFHAAGLTTLDCPAALLTCKPGVVARTFDLEAGMPDKVVVQEGLVATGEPRGLLNKLPS
jgi:hypothetical protein